MISLNGHSLDVKTFGEIILAKKEFALSEEMMQSTRKAFEFLTSFLQKKLIYGINTGFGPMAQYRIDDDKLIDLQYNIIRSHSSGMSDYLEEKYAKAVLLNLLHAMARGLSGIDPELIPFLKTMYDKNIIPCIPLHGGVGASGDLVQMAHVALTVIGEGDVYYNNKITPTNEVFEKENIAPFKIKIREGIAIMNGTTAMTAVAALNILNAQKALEWSLALSMTINEIMESYDDHISEPLNRAKRQKGQQTIAKASRDFIAGSKLIKSREKELYNQTVEDTIIEHKVQEYYSLRSIPQILGPIYDTIAYTTEIVENELNSTTDNPVIDVDTQNVYHGSNFHGDYISLEMDKLKLAMTRLSMLAERQLNYLVNPAINNKLAPFINRGTLGLNFGLQGIQFTATSTTAENQALSTSLYIHSIPNNNDNQDIVSMGFNAACMTKKVIENTFEVLAIEAVAVVQAIRQLKSKDNLSPSAKSMFNSLQAIFPEMVEDRSTRKELIAVKEYLMNNLLTILYK